MLTDTDTFAVGGEVIPQSPPTAAADKSISNATTSKSPSKQEARQQTSQQQGSQEKHTGGLYLAPRCGAWDVLVEVCQGSLKCDVV